MSFSRRELALVLVLLGTAAACRKPPPDGVTEPYTLCVGPLEAGGDAQAAVDAVAAALTQGASLPTRGRAFARDVDAVRALGAGRCDLGLLNAFTYLFARSEYGATPLLRVVREGASSYRGAILVRAGGEPLDIGQLRDRNIAFTHPHSLSGFLLPAKLLRERGVAPRKQVFAGSHLAALQSLVKGEVDAAATYYHPNRPGSAPLAERHGLKDKVRILAVTESLPYEPLFVRREIPEAQRVRLSAAFGAVARTPEGRNALARLGQIDGFEPTREQEYAQVAATIRAAGKAIEDLIPGAWRLSAQNRPNFEFWP
jgi:phosphonate transport system substrate-binding protein